MACSKVATNPIPENFQNPRRQMNVILFGESGVGKSAVVNQLFNRKIVVSSDQAVGCTLLNTRVNGFIEDHPDIEWNIYDTVGLSESSDGNVPTTTAFVQLIKLAYSVPGGIHLLVCCHAKGRISGERFKANYRIFKEDLCENRIPCLLVVTKCDGDDPIDDWWFENEGLVRNQLKFNFADGVCVSTVRTKKRSPNVVETDYKVSRSNLFEAVGKHALEEAVLIDSWSRKVMVAARDFFNQIRGWLPWFRLQRHSLRPDLVAMFESLGHSNVEAREKTEVLLRELTEMDLLAPYHEVQA